MSTLAISESTFLNLAHTLGGIDYTGNGQKYQHVGHSLVNKGHQWGFKFYELGQLVNPNNKEYQGLYRLFGYLYNMNDRAYRNAYKHIEDLDYKYYNFRTITSGLTPVRLDIYQVLKSLQCIRYNIDVKCEHLNRLIELVQDAIIDNLDEYNAAQWG